MGKEIKYNEAEWIEIKKLNSGFTVYECSACGKGDTFAPSIVGTKFCPHCGKRMINFTSTAED